MKAIRLNNGETCFIYRGNDVLEIVGENLSYELAEYIKENFYSSEEMDAEIEELNSKYWKLFHEKKDIENKILDYKLEISRLEKENEQLKNPKPVLTELLDDENELPFW